MPPPPAVAWTSDRLRPKQKPKKKHPPADVAAPKSLQVRLLELLITSLDALSDNHPTRDPRGGCFCLARNHPLSPHTPLCTSCGLVLCSLNKPYHLCPSSHCPSPNLFPSPEHRTNLLANLRHQLSSEIQKEEDLKLKLAEEKKKEAGAFPSLQSTSLTNPKAITHEQPTHKVLSITSSSQSKTKNRKVVTLSTQPSPSSSVPPSRTESPSLSADDDSRIPEPPKSVIHAHPPPSEVLKSRPWRNFILGLDDDDDASVDIKYTLLNP